MIANSSLVPGLSTAIWRSALVVLGVLAVAFLVGRILHRYRDIDVFWPLGFVAVAVAGYLGSSGGDLVQRVLLVTVVGIWGLRLAAHLAWRGRGEPEDPRYARIIKGAKGRNELLYALVVIYGLQAVLMWFVSLCATVGFFAARPLRALEAIGAVIWLVGFAFEAIGDAQLSSFRSDPSNRGKVMDRGLWSWTRHPNYFGDATAWWGIFLIAAAGGWGALSILSPLLMTRLLTSVSGKPLLEAQLRRSRPGYAEYLERTSGFLPRPPRRR